MLLRSLLLNGARKTTMPVRNYRLTVRRLLPESGTGGTSSQTSKIARETPTMVTDGYYNDVYQRLINIFFIGSFISFYFLLLNQKYEFVQVLRDEYQLVNGRIGKFEEKINKFEADLENLKNGLNKKF